MTQPFKPAWWLPSSHLQTLWPTLCRRPRQPSSLSRERLELPDGDFIDVDWVGRHKTGPIVMVLHGLEGSAQSSYAKGMLNAIEHHGWRGMVMHFRSCSGERNRLPRTYHSGETSDLATLIHLLHEREPETPLSVIGFSLGGNVLLKWLGETAECNPLSAAVAVSVPFELYKSVERIRKGFSRVYQLYLLKQLYKKIQWKFLEQPSPLPIPPFSEIHSIRDFDEKITAPLHGFDSADDYYDQSSSRQYLHKIRVPTLLVQAKDDPFMTDDLLPKPHELSSTVSCEWTEKGGHVGFVTGDYPWRARYWLEERIPAYLSTFL